MSLTLIHIIHNSYLLYKAPPYRVIIKKQPKKGEQVHKEVSCSDTDKNEQHLEDEVNLPEDKEDVGTDDREAGDSENQNDDLDENQNSIIVEDNDVKIESQDEDLVEHSESISDDIEIVEAPTPEKRLSINLEEQLALVQRQLQALAQLPSTIQETLNTVTQQLSELVIAQHSQAQEVTVEAKVTTEDETTEEYLEVSALTPILKMYVDLLVVTQIFAVDHEENVLSVLEEERSEHIDDETVQELHEDMVKNESEDEQALFEELEKQIEEEEQRRLEELEMRRIEQERIQKKDKKFILERRTSLQERRCSQPRTPLQRPIVLPGGRKWCNPDDAISKIRRPSMTDEKIDNTINMFSEVIVGRTMG
ncbi:pdz and lim domain protein zasp [Holotrichia oblita]|uniref:Pdz and lim domain protein zasp n=1 Tax=Holotrichia oblita TaxID=644536 RepID=A0ACB9TDR9_HOLOL|nr:pdz and lim domain protein zasp [Holotrichia oblita]